jgi:hypothetical protein
MTPEELELAFENAPTLEDKCNLVNSVLISQLNTFMNTEGESDEFIKMDETLKNLAKDLNFLRIDKEQEENNQCEEEIKKGKYEIYTCIKEIPNFKYNDFKCNVGDLKHIKIDDIASEYISKGVDQISPEMAEYISNIEPIITIISDSGIGTLKFKKIFTKEIGNFNDYFVKQ